MNVKTTFLYGDLDEDIYMKQPKRYILKGQKNKLCKFVKSLYGQKQALKQCYQKINKIANFVISI